MFYHDIQGKSSLNYMWKVNDGSIYLVGYVPIEAIQQEGRTVNQNIFIVVVVMLIAFFCAVFCIILIKDSRIESERSGRKKEKYTISVWRKLYRQHRLQVIPKRPFSQICHMISVHL